MTTITATIIKMRMRWAVAVKCMRGEMKISLEDLNIHKRIILKLMLKE
jgi:hypothetical protein